MIEIPYLRFRDCIAKTTREGNPGLSVEKHCLHVGAVAKALHKRLPPSTRRLIPESTVFLAALHDVGKISPGFQKLIQGGALQRISRDLHRAPACNFNTNHAEISQSAFTSWLKKRAANSSAEKWGRVLGRHHGKDDNKPKPDSASEYGGRTWQEERHALIDYLYNRFDKLPDGPPISDEQEFIASGFVCVADWIGSDEDFFPAEGLPDGTDLNARADHALDECGWIFPQSKRGLEFQDIFKIHLPNGLQAALIKRVRSDVPGLYVIEAPMGQGKTEAALFIAYHLMSSGTNSGIYFGLPTRLTSERIYHRVADFLANTHVEMHSRPRLIHGQAWLKAGAEELSTQGTWFLPKKRALLLPYGVGTIDQALLGVMRVRHHFLRTFGLAGKVVILDEVHSYDAYTGTLLEELVKSLIASGCSVIILSATLTRERRKRLLGDHASDLSDSYPLISFQEQSGKLHQFFPPAPEGKKIRLSKSKRNPAALAAIAVQRASRGQCVLWIANTVSEAQHYYHVLQDLSGGLQTGLLHSRFPSFRREELENFWMDSLGKNGKRPNGCVLIATQVVEQSVDIDADFLITDLAPTDMLLQRIGRLWRHPRENRPCDEPEVLLVTGDLDRASDIDSLKRETGLSSLVYAPYVLWRTHQVWKVRNHVKIPDEIRSLLESTYSEEPGEVLAFVTEMKRDLEKRKLQLNEKALGGLAQAMPTADDDELVVTRHSDVPTVKVVLVWHPAKLETTETIVLADGKPVNLNGTEKDIPVLRRIHLNMVEVGRYFIEKRGMPKGLERHLRSDVQVLIIGENGRLLYPDGKETQLKYDEIYGVERIDVEIN